MLDILTRLVPTGTSPRMRTKSDRGLFLLNTNARSAENAVSKINTPTSIHRDKGERITHQLIR